MTLFERVAAPRPVGAGLLLQPSGLLVLEQLGLAAQISASGARVDRLLGTTPGGRAVMDLRYADAGADVHGIGVHRGLLSDALWSAVQQAGISARKGTAVDAVEQTDDRVRIALAGVGHAGDFDLAVIADGTFSQLRSQLPIPHTVTVYPWGAWWAVLPDPELRFQGVLRQTYHRASRMLGIMPIGRLPSPALDATPHVTLFWSVRRDIEATLRTRGLEAWKSAVLALAPEVESLVAQISDFGQLIFSTYADVRMHPWHHGRVVVIGDAAHATSPQLGQGANLALVDALALARSLEAQTGVAAALSNYSTKRRAHLNYYQWASSVLTPVFQSNARVLPLLRDALMPVLCRMPGARGPMLATLTGRKAGFLWGKLKLD